MEAPKKRGRPAKSIENLNIQPYQPPTDDQTPVDLVEMHTQKRTTKRTFHSQAQHMHDLYKLEVAPFLKNVAVDGMQPDYEKTEHVHYYHTITSDGKTQTKSTSVAGHFHKVEVIQNGKDEPPTVKCVSGPMREVVKIQYGKRVRTEVPVNDVDFHTHEVKYRKSNVILERTKNVEAAKAEAALQARYTQSSPDITESVE